MVVRVFLTPSTVVLICLFNLFAISPGFAQSDALTATVDRSTVSLGDSVWLRVVLEGNNTSETLDVTGLVRDFEVLDHRKNTQMSIVNGRRNVTTEWNYLIEPKRVGALQIPSLALGLRRTQPIDLQVTKKQGIDGFPTDEAIHVELTAEPKSGYVQGQFIATVRFYNRVPIIEGSLDSPEPENATMLRLGDDHNYMTQRNGQRWSVTERKFAIFPESSGTLELPAVRFVGRIADNRDRFGSLFNRGRRVSTKADSIELEVKARPDTYDGQYWLPAKELTLEDKWSDPKLEVRVGDPITRTISLQARGLLSTQLPRIEMPSPDNVRVYPDQPVEQNLTGGGDFIGRIESKYAVVPTDPGELTLPPIKLSWWDTKQNQVQVAELPARTLTVLPAPSIATPNVVPEIGVQGPITAPAQSSWVWRATAVIALLGWLITGLLWWRSNQASTPARPKKSHVQPSEAGLKRACSANNAAATLEALRRLFSTETRSPTIGEIRNTYAATPLAGAIDNLLASRYAAVSSSWDGDAFWQAYQRSKVTMKHQSGPQSQLPPLYAD